MSTTTSDPISPPQSEQSAPHQASATADVEPLPPFTVVVPAYNEQDGIEETLDALLKTLDATGGPFEVIVVNDGSTDETGSLLSSRNDVRLIEHPSNLGYGASLKSGIRQARYDLIVITDADGTYPVDRILDLVRLCLHRDMVVGARSGRESHYSRLRAFAKWFLIRFAQWMARRPIPDLNSGLRVLRKPVVERFLNILPDGFSFTTTITLAMLTNRYAVHYEPIEYLPRKGTSKIQPIRDTLRFIMLILRTGMYFAPLRVFLPVAMVFFAGFLAVFTRDAIRGDLSESTLLLLVASAQMGMFALLADMIDKRSG